MFDATSATVGARDLARWTQQALDHLPDTHQDYCIVQGLHALAVLSRRYNGRGVTLTAPDCTILIRHAPCLESVFKED